MKALRDVKGAAEVFGGVSTWTVRKYERDGLLKAVRIGRRVMFEEEELERFIDECKKARDQEERDAQ